MAILKMTGLAWLTRRSRRKCASKENVPDHRPARETLGIMSGADMTVEHMTNRPAPRTGEPEELRQAVGRFAPTRLRSEQIPDALAELEEIRLQTEQSANVIMERAEALMDSSMDEAVGILEACAFQDIVGQRIGKVVEILQSMGTRLDDLIDETGVSDSVPLASDSEPEAERRRRELILHGPQLTGEGVSQDEIDALLGA